MKVFHLIPDDLSEKEHTPTADCHCRPIRIDLKPPKKFRGVEHIEFHREVGGKAA